MSWQKAGGGGDVGVVRENVRKNNVHLYNCARPWLAVGLLLLLLLLSNNKADNLLIEQDLS